MTDPKKSNFLGGGPRFNTVGNDHSGPADPDAGDTGPILIPSIRSPDALRRLLAIVALVLLACLVFYLSDRGLGGVERQGGRGGRGAPVRPDINPDGPLR